MQITKTIYSRQRSAPQRELQLWLLGMCACKLKMTR